MKKGFTLVELLGAIILLGLISLLIAVPIVARINNASGKISRATERILKEHVMQYISENSNDFRSTKPGTKYYITLDELEFNRDGFEVKVNNKNLDPSTQVLIEINENGDYDISVLNDSEKLSSIKETYADGAYVIFNGFTWRMISKDDNTKTVRLACNETVGGVSEYAEQDYLNSQTYKWLNNEFASKLNYINVIKETDNGLINILTLAESNANPLDGFRYYVVNEEGKIKASTNVNANSLIRPAINVYEGTVITGGTGTDSDPYILREYKNNQSESTFKEADISVGEYISFDDKLYRIIEYGSDTVKLISTFSDGISAYANEGETFNLNNGAGAYLNNPSRVSKYMAMNNVFIGGFSQNDYTKSLKKTNVVYGVYKALPKVGEIIPYPLDNKNQYRLMTMYSSDIVDLLRKDCIAGTNFASEYDLLYTTYISANNTIQGGTGTKDDPYMIGTIEFNGTYVPATSEDTHKGIVYMNPTNFETTCNSSSAEETGCMKFYVYDDEGSKYKLLLEKNLLNSVAWASHDDFIATGGTEEGWSADKTAKGPVTAVKVLNQNTLSWIKQPRLISADEIAHIVGIDEAVGWNSTTATLDNAQFYFDGSGNTISGWHTRTTSSSNKSRYAWIFDNLNWCDMYGCNKSNSDADGAYWTSSIKNTGLNDSALCVDYKAGIGNFISYVDGSKGIRPVIELPKYYFNS